MALLTGRTWVWLNSGSWWWTGRPGALWFIGSQRVGHDSATELNWTELNDLVVFPTFFNLSLNLPIRSSCSEPQSAPGLGFADCIELLHHWLQRINQSDFGIDHLVMSMCTVFSCVIWIGCLSWPVRSLCKTLLAFALLHSVLQSQICLLLQVFLDFLLLHSSPL